MSYKIIDLPALGRPFNATDIIEVSADGTGSYKANIGNFTLGGENYIFVNSNGTPTENGNAVRYAYNLAQTMTPNGNPLDYNNKVIILLAPGYYTFKEESEGPFIVDQNWIDLESLTGSRDVFFSSIQVNSPSPGIIVNISGIDITKNNYYPHAAFAVASSGGIDEFLTIQNCKGRDYSFSSFSTGFNGIYNNCEARNYSFCSTGDTLTPPAGIISTADGNFDNYGNISNCTAQIYSFVSGLDVPAGAINNYGRITNCNGEFGCFCYSSWRANNYSFIENCTADDYSFCASSDIIGTGKSTNSSSIINCKAYGNGICVYGGGSFDPAAAINTGLISGCYSRGGASFVIIDGLGVGTNQGNILDCYTEEQGFCGSDGFNSGKIINCTARDYSFCSSIPSNNSGQILRCTLLEWVFTVGTPSGTGRVVLGIDTTGVVNF
jgi:hypothetical protein